MGGGFNRWWLLPVGILVCSALVSLNIVVFGPSFLTRSSAGPAPLPAEEVSGEADAGGGCSGALATDYACHQERYRDLVLNGGVEAAFRELKADYKENGYVEANCHQMTHVIGRASVEVHGDIPGAYSRGDSFCWSGYYHGAMEAVVARIGPERILAVAPGVCADLGEGNDRYSFHHYNCAHGLGHGFMSLRANELYESLGDCDTLPDAWERDACYGGVFMENVVVAGDDPDRPPSEYLDPERPLYPCTDVGDRYKDQCYGMQTSYALKTQDNDFAKVFELCAGVEGAYRPTCYGSLGRDVSGQSDNDPEKIEAVCMLGPTYEARSNCVIGAARTFVSYYNSDEEARSLCLSVKRRLQTSCLAATEEYYATL